MRWAGPRARFSPRETVAVVRDRFSGKYLVLG
jgi:hypothetical protein